MSVLTEYLISFFLLAGATFALIGSIGLMRLPDFYLRLHGPAKATTLGVGGIILGSVIFFSTQGDGLSLHELLIALFLFITAPVSCHIVAKAALHLKLPAIERTRGKPWEDDLIKAEQEAKAAIAEGRFVTESVNDHIRRITDL
ncbi:Na+/H+ antiporter subunit G [Cellvibrio fontiphilus]|uniref:Na+/H+ antiporter subunit G n=1 Tax=Cellvibrio fontiphilus TaxID=1815559 RepID=A0ABV7FF21_9GAMM